MKTGTATHAVVEETKAKDDNATTLGKCLADKACTHKENNMAMQIEMPKMHTSAFQRVQKRGHLHGFLTSSSTEHDDGAAGPTRDVLTPLRDAAVAWIEGARLKSQVGRQNTVFSPRIIGTNVEIQAGAMAGACNFEKEEPKRKTQLEKELAPGAGKHKSSAEIKAAEDEMQEQREEMQVQEGMSILGQCFSSLHLRQTCASQTGAMADAGNFANEEMQEGERDAPARNTDKEVALLAEHEEKMKTTETERKQEVLERLEKVRAPCQARL